MLKNSHPIKDLRIIPRDLKDVVIVDNSVMSFRYRIEMIVSNQLDNGIPILNFFDDKNDIELLHLIEFLKTNVLPSDDVRLVLREAFKLGQYTDFQNGR